MCLNSCLMESFEANVEVSILILTDNMKTRMDEPLKSGY